MISILQLGTVDYATGLRLQQQLVALRKEEKIGDILLLLEHTPVITLGRNAKAANVVASRDLLSQRSVELFECDRGGDVTFHGPGQIVGYPIFDLRSHVHGAADANGHVGTAAPGRPVERSSTFRKHLGAVEFVRRLEDVLMRTCADFAIPTKRVPGLTGVWTDAEGTNAHVGTAAPGCPVERSSTAEGHDSMSRSLQSTDLAFPAHVGTAAPGCPVERSSTAEGHDSMSRSLQSTDLAFPAHVGTAAPGCPVERSSTAAAESATRSEKHHNREGHDFSRAISATDGRAALAAEGTESKLAAIGIHISRFVTSHGFALNVNTDLSYFDLIIPCGITSKPVTSMQRELGHPLDLDAVAQSISRNFGLVFQTQVLWLDSLDALLGHTVGVPMKTPAELRQMHKEDDTTWA